MDDGICWQFNELAVKLADELGNENGWRENVVFSPSVILKALALLTAGACGESLQILIKIFMGSEDIDESRRKSILHKISKLMENSLYVKLNAKVFASSTVQVSF